jgi:hypothetical protein
MSTKMEFADFINEEIKKYKIISIIGLAKNVSKTTTLNHIIQILKGNHQLGLTSIGRDGEKYDVITTLPKPRIFIETGTIVATALESVKNSEIKMETIKNTGIYTPMGEIMILKPYEAGYIELAGPSINSELKEVCDELLNLGCDLVLIDGAFDRRSYASPQISQATIFSTGASVSKSLKDVVDLSHHVLNLLSIQKEADPRAINAARNIVSKSKVGIIETDYSIETLDLLTALDGAEEIQAHLNEDSKILVINGAITDALLNEMMRLSRIYKEVRILVPDATKLFLSKKTYEIFIKKGGTIRVLDPIQIIMVTVNPTSPLGYEFNKMIFLNKIKKGINIPVYDLGPSKY